jgi:hypothetical protein
MNIVRASLFQQARHDLRFDRFEDLDRYFERTRLKSGIWKGVDGLINGKVELNTLLPGNSTASLYQTRGRIGTTIHFDDEFSKRCTIVEILAQDAFEAAIQDRVHLIARLQYRRRTDYDGGSSRDRCVYITRAEKLPSELEGQLQRISSRNWGTQQRDDNW